MLVIGYRKSDFKANDGAVISGYNLYVTYEQEYVSGEACERLFVSTRKLNGYVPEVGDVISVVYNRYGKVDGIIKQ